MKTKFVIFNDHFLHLECIKSALLQNFSKSEIFGTNNLNDLKGLSQNVVFLLDVSFYNSIDSFLLLDKILLIQPSINILVISKNSNADFIRKLYKKGIKGFLTSNSSIQELFFAVDEICKNSTYIGESIKKIIFDSAFCTDEKIISNNNKLSEDLTKREIELLRFLCEGLTGKEIAEKMFISKSTVESHKRSMMLKLNIHNTTRLMKFAMDNNILHS